MIDRLIELHKNSYVPISKFPVSAAVTTKDGNTFYGVNVEDASTRAGTCAERNAIFNAITNGYKKGDFKELHCLCADSNKVSTSCFACRQVISELFDEDVPLYFYSNTGESKKYTVEELCPYPFDEDDLK